MTASEVFHHVSDMWIAPENYENLPVAEMDRYLDFWNLMAYDYYTSTTASHSANLYPSDSNPSSTPFLSDTILHTVWMLTS